MNSSYSLNKPPFFNGEVYSLWKEKMIFFIEWMNRGIWNAVKESSFVPTQEVNGVVENNPKRDWTKDVKENMQHSLKAKVVITTALGLYEFL